VGARLPEAEEPEADQTRRGHQVQRPRVGQHAEAEHECGDQRDRRLVPDRDRRQRAQHRPPLAVLHPEADREQPSHRGV
jgi:hypothetical protein